MVFHFVNLEMILVFMIHLSLGLNISIPAFSFLGLPEWIHDMVLFKSSGGLRQGDPVSTHPFILSMEILSKLLSKVGKSGFNFSNDVNVELSREPGNPPFLARGKEESVSFLADNIQIKLASWKVKIPSMGR